MPTPRKLPDCDVLRRHVEAGMTNQSIGEMYGTTQEAVRQALLRCEIRRPEAAAKIRYELPWRVRADHQKDQLARLLRVYRKRQMGRPMTASEQKLLDDWLEYMERDNPHGIPLSVHYDRTRDDGFYLMPRQPGDVDYMSPPVSA